MLNLLGILYLSDLIDLFHGNKSGRWMRPEG